MTETLTTLTIPWAPTSTEAVTLTVTAPLSHVCPVVHERDYGTVVIAYKPAVALLELHGLADLLRSYADREVTHEALTGELHRVLHETLAPEALTVTTSWTTAGLEYAVTIGGER